MKQLDQPARSPQDLSPEDRARLEDAHRRLRAAVDAYQPFLGGELPPREDIKPYDAQAMARAQQEIEAAEAKLWHLREELLGWSRPAWAPRASIVSDWFSAEDSVYDEYEAPATS
jgi:hypothetical protein